jgi:alpha-tubulin suppressor-like RCC1 family protein
MLTLLKRFLYTLPLVFIGWLGSMPGHATESSAVAIAAGADHACALTTAGGVKCWGGNYLGKLGDNTNLERLTPVNVVGLASGVLAIAASDGHTCALTTAGGVKCWGANSNGQLGDNSQTNRLTPVDVVGLSSGVLAIAAGDGHTCALTTAGGVKCWGANSSGQLGDNTTTMRKTPVDVVGLTSGVAAIAAGLNHTCALTTAGGVKCWGYNLAGELGDNTTTMRQDTG